MVITFANQKGGVGKTTTVLNLSVYLAKLGKKILIIDLDPQANLTSGLGYSESKTGNKTIYEVLLGEVTLQEVFLSTRIENLFLVPSNISLAGAEIDLVSMMNRESLLKKAIKKLKEEFDYILIDCPPSLGLLTINALSASDKIIIPVQCEYYALEGLGQLVDTVKLVKNNLNSYLEIGGVILTMYDQRIRLSDSIVDEVEKYFHSKVFETKVNRNVRLSEAPSHGKSIFEYDPNSSGAKSYQKLAEEFIKRFDSE